jgi:hypothetical protein
MNDTAQATTIPAGEIEKRTAQYVALRDKIKAMKDDFKETLKPYDEALDMLNSWLLDQLNKTGAVHIATKSGTIYRIVRQSASIADPDVFWNYVVDNEAWDLIDRRANVIGVVAHSIEQGKLPPGVNLNQYSEAGVRRA